MSLLMTDSATLSHEMKDFYFYRSKMKDPINIQGEIQKCNDLDSDTGSKKIADPTTAFHMG
jgi:hypothetical protein